MVHRNNPMCSASFMIRHLNCYRLDTNPYVYESDSTYPHRRATFVRLLEDSRTYRETSADIGFSAHRRAACCPLSPCSLEASDRLVGNSRRLSRVSGASLRCLSGVGKKKDPSPSENLSNVEWGRSCCRWISCPAARHLWCGTLPVTNLVGDRTHRTDTLLRRQQAFGRTPIRDPGTPAGDSHSGHHFQP